MGKELYDFYVKAGNIGGVKARTRLSILTKISSLEAKALPDSPERIKLFEKSLQTVIHEFEAGPKIGSTEQLPQMKVGSAKDSADQLRKQIHIFTDLTAQRSLYLNDMDSTYKRVTESMAEGIEVTRASIWFYNEDRTGITCADLFIKDKGEHAAGTFLSANDFPAYFKSIETERTLAAHNAHTDPRTIEFSQIYLTPLGINSMLDVPIWANGKMVGVLCHEQVGPGREWTTDEESFAYLMSNIVAMAIEKNQPVA